MVSELVTICSDFIDESAEIINKPEFLKVTDADAY